jgi:hypothetical protein
MISIGGKFPTLLNSSENQIESCQLGSLCLFILNSDCHCLIAHPFCQQVNKKLCDHSIPSIWNLFSACRKYIPVHYLLPPQSPGCGRNSDLVRQAVLPFVIFQVVASYSVFSRNGSYGWKTTIIPTRTSLYFLIESGICSRFVERNKHFNTATGFFARRTPA